MWRATLCFGSAIAVAAAVGLPIFAGHAILRERSVTSSIIRPRANAAKATPDGRESQVTLGPTAAAAITQGAAPCSDPSQLQLAVSIAAESPDHQYLIGTLTNSGTPCTLAGYPAVAERNSAGSLAPVIQTTDATDSQSRVVTVGQPPQVASFYIDQLPCATQTQLPLGDYTVDLSFTGLTGPIQLQRNSPISFCVPQSAVVSPITQGAVSIPGFSSAGQPPDQLPVPQPTKSSGARP